MGEGIIPTSSAPIARQDEKYSFGVVGDCRQL
jgi:hypothetical protein